MNLNLTNPLVLYVNPRWRRDAVHTPLLNPWWGNPYGPASVFSKQMFDSYSPNKGYYTITDNLEEAEMVLLPYMHRWYFHHRPDLFEEGLRVAKQAKIPLLIDGSGDAEYPVGSDDVYVLYYGGYRFLSTPNRIQIPLAVDDLLERCRSGKLEVREKGTGRPVVGFAGWAQLSFKQYFRTIVKELPVRLRALFQEQYRSCTKGVLWRRKAIKLLQNSRRIDFRLRERRSFSANPKTAEDDMEKLREEMVDTIWNSDYALDVRGDANNSARLFEILSLGRIPVIVDTERIFPFSDRVDYSAFALLVDFRDLKKLPEIIADFHNKVSAERFKEMQESARNTYLQYFRIDAFMRYVVEDLRRRTK